MREQVTIVLNEREPTKARAAEALQAALRDLGVSASRLAITEAIEDVVVERKPTVVILDYLLGDYSTGLDIVSRLNALQASERPIIFFLTDEPSVHVAVQAMRLGAIDYLEIDHPQSVQNLARSISHHLQQRTSKKQRATLLSGNPSPITFDDLIAESQSCANARHQLLTIAKQRAPITIIEGPLGSGKRTWASVYQSLRPKTPLHRECDLRLCVDSPQAITGHHSGRMSPRLGADLSLTIYHAEEDDGGILDWAAQNASTWWHTPSDSFLTICTSSPATTVSWSALLDSAHIIRLPKLEDRREDIGALMQRFCAETSTLTGDRLKPFDAATIRWAESAPWPGNIRQLRAVAIETALRSHRDKNLTAEETIEHQHGLWMHEHSLRDSSCEPAGDEESAMTLARTLELCGHSYRAAAALLGCSTRQLLNRLSDASTRSR